MLSDRCLSCLSVTVYSEHLRFFGFSFFIILFCSVPCDRLSWLLVSFWAHVNIVNRIVSYRWCIVAKRLDGSRCHLVWR